MRSGCSSARSGCKFLVTPHFLGPRAQCRRKLLKYDYRNNYNRNNFLGLNREKGRMQNKKQSTEEPCFSREGGKREKEKKRVSSPMEKAMQAFPSLGEVHLRNPRLSEKYPPSSQGFELDALLLALFLQVCCRNQKPVQIKQWQQVLGEAVYRFLDCSRSLTPVP